MIVATLLLLLMLAAVMISGGRNGAIATGIAAEAPIVISIDVQTITAACWPHWSTLQMMRLLRAVVVVVATTGAWTVVVRRQGSRDVSTAVVVARSGWRIRIGV